MKAEPSRREKTRASRVAAWVALGISIVVAVGLSACGSTGSGGAAVRTSATPTPTAPASATAAQSVAPSPTSLATPPRVSAPPFVSRPHAVIAACRLVDARTADAATGATLSKDDTLSGSVGGIYGGPAGYVQDDCAYTAASSGPTVRVVVFEPARGHGTAAQGQQALAWTKADLEDHGATLDGADGVGDAALVWAPSGAAFAEVVVQDHEVVFSVGVEQLPDPLTDALRLAVQALERADSGAANGPIGS